MSNYMVRVKVNPEPPKKRIVGGMSLVRWRCSGQPGDASMLVVKKSKENETLCCHSVLSFSQKASRNCICGIHDIPTMRGSYLNR